MPDRAYPGPERRKFRRVELSYPIRIESVSKGSSGSAIALDGLTVNLSFGGALVGVSSASGLQGATPIEVSFVDSNADVDPPALSGVVWRLAPEDNGILAIEFDTPLKAFSGSVELDDRLEWLRSMGGPEFLSNIVESFLTSVPDRIRMAIEGGQSGDLQVVAEAARSLKSSAGNIGAVSLYEVARRAEQAALEGDAARAARLVGELRDYFTVIKDQLAR